MTPVTVGPTVVCVTVDDVVIACRDIDITPVDVEGNVCCDTVTAGNEADVVIGAN